MSMDITMLSAAMQNPNAPMALTPHFAFCIIATIVFGAQYIRKRTNNYIYLIIAVDLTLITQFFAQKYVITAAFFAEIILLVMAFVAARNAKKAKEKAADSEQAKELMKKGEEDAAALKVNIRKYSDKNNDDSDYEADNNKEDEDDEE